MFLVSVKIDVIDIVSDTCFLFLFVTGSADFVGINHYTTNLVAHKEQPIDVPHYERDQDIDISYSACWNTYVDIQFELSYYVSFVRKSARVC